MRAPESPSSQLRIRPISFDLIRAFFQVQCPRRCLSSDRCCRVPTRARRSRRESEETSAWSTDVNNTQRRVAWQMKIDDARTKLTSIYPQLKK
jgi:hypothetical protein